MKRELSFSQRMKAGWSKEKLMKHYDLDDKHYTKVLACLQNLKGEKEHV